MRRISTKREGNDECQVDQIDSQSVKETEIWTDRQVEIWTNEEADRKSSPINELDCN